MVLICRNWPDDLLSFARRGELSEEWEGCIPQCEGFHQEMSLRHVFQIPLPNSEYVIVLVVCF